MSKTILIVDDEPDILFTVAQVLESCGYNVIKANCGKECIDKLKDLDASPDLIVLDIMMPEISGWDVAAEIKQSEKYADVPIIFLTAKGDTMSVGMGNLSAEDYIVKPFDISNLKERIEKILKKSC